MGFRRTMTAFAFLMLVPQALFAATAPTSTTHEDGKGPRAEDEEIPFQKSSRENPGIAFKFDLIDGAFGHCGGSVVDLSNLSKAGGIAQKLGFPQLGKGMSLLGLSKRCFVLTAAHCLENTARKGAVESGEVTFETPYTGKMKGKFTLHPSFVHPEKDYPDAKGKVLTDDIGIIEPPADFCQALSQQKAPRSQVCPSPKWSNEMVAASNRKNSSFTVSPTKNPSEKDAFVNVMAEANTKVPHGANLGDSGGPIVDKTSGCWEGALSNKDASKAAGNEYSKDLNYTGPKDWLWVWGQLLKKTIAGVFAKS